MSKILIPDGTADSEIIIKKSRFLGIAVPVDRAETVKEIVKKLHREHPRARHIAYAYIIGDKKSLFGMTDAGEPHGTAGRPILDVLKGSDLTDTAVIVIRYFGGIKLGTGGLVSAYSSAAKETLNKLPVKEKIPMVVLSLITEYQDYEKILRILENFSGTVENEHFTTKVELTVKIPEKYLSEFKDSLRETGRGGIIVKET